MKYKIYIDKLPQTNINIFVMGQLRLVGAYKNYNALDLWGVYCDNTGKYDDTEDSNMIHTFISFNNISKSVNIEYINSVYKCSLICTYKKFNKNVALFLSSYEVLLMVVAGLFCTKELDNI